MFEGLPDRHFRCILADPPWRFRTWNEENQAKAASNHYDLMTTRDICRLPVERLAARDSILFLWVSNPQLEDGLRVMRSWGFQYKTVAFTWAKTSRASGMFLPKWHMALGYWTRANSEQVLLGVKGKPVRLAKDVRQLIVSRVREHSRKPDDAYSRIERLCDGPRLELFGRQQRLGWTVCGNETSKFPTNSGAA